MSSSVQARFDQTLSRADDLLRQRLRREEAELEAEAVAREDARRQRQRDNAEACRQIQARYADAFRSFDAEVPLPTDGEASTAFRKRMFNRLARRLASSHELSDLRADDVSSSTVGFDHFEAQMIEAAKAEGLRPSFENLPSDGTLISRQRVDPDTNERSIEWHGRSSFIKGMGREGHRVLRIVDPKSRSVLWGAPFDVAR